MNHIQTIYNYMLAQNFAAKRDNKGKRGKSIKLAERHSYVEKKKTGINKAKLYNKRIHNL